MRLREDGADICFPLILIPGFLRTLGGWTERRSEFTDEHMGTLNQTGGLHAVIMKPQASCLLCCRGQSSGLGAPSLHQDVCVSCLLTWFLHEMEGGFPS